MNSNFWIMAGFLTIFVFAGPSFAFAQGNTISQSQSQSQNGGQAQSQQQSMPYPSVQQPYGSPQAGVSDQRDPSYGQQPGRFQMPGQVRDRGNIFTKIIGAAALKYLLGITVTEAVSL